MGPLISIIDKLFLCFDKNSRFAVAVWDSVIGFPSWPQQIWKKAKQFENFGESEKKGKSTVVFLQMKLRHGYFGQITKKHAIQGLRCKILKNEKNQKS